MTENINESIVKSKDELLKRKSCVELLKATEQFDTECLDDCDLIDTSDDANPELVEEVVSQNQVWSGSIFNVDRMQVKLPEGQMATRDVIRHPGAVAIIAITDDNKICLVRQYRAAIGRITLELPAGKLDPGEDPLDCANRELKEETGVVADKMAYLTTIATTPGFTDELIHIYMATGLTFEQPCPDEDEYISIDLVDSNDLVDAVLDGQIEDAKTVVGSLIWDAVSRRLM